VIAGPSGKPPFSPRATLAIGLALAIPFALRSATTVEPYPAVLFPAGAGKVSLDRGAVIVPLLSIKGRDGQGVPRELPAEKLLAPIPVQYLWSLAARDFGQAPPTPLTLALKKGGPERTFSRPAPDAASRREARLWLADRLHAAQLQGPLLIDLDEVAFDRATGRELSRKRVSERHVSLD
jgi:hypothetical protein